MAMPERIGVGLIGLGTVGTGVAKILTRQAELIRRRLGVRLDLVRVATRRAANAASIPLPAHLVTTDAAAVVADPQVQIVVELIGGEEPARTLILGALKAGKPVVTANKALLAVHGEELFAAAQAAGLDLGFEGSVGGGIPIVKALKEGLAANEIQSIYGIINGTANYILTPPHNGEIMRGSVVTVVNYEIPTAAYGEITAQDDARERAAETMAERFRAELALRMAQARESAAHGR